MTKRKTVAVSFRLPSALVERIDQRMAAWSRALPGITVTRTDMVLVLLGAGLQSAAAEPPKVGMTGRKGSASRDGRDGRKTRKS